MSPVPRAADLIDVPLRRLAALGGLDPVRLAVLRDLASGSETFARGANLNAARGERLRFLGSGWAGLTRGDGRTPGQIFSVLAPGDPIDLSLIDPANCIIIALTRVEVVDFTPALDRLATDCELAGVAAALGRAEAVTETRLIDHMMRLGSRNAYSGLAQFFLDIHRRMDEVGLSGPDGCPMPLGQTSLASAFCMTASHINRTIQQLRIDGVIELSGEQLRLPDLDALLAVAAAGQNR